MRSEQTTKDTAATAKQAAQGDDEELTKQRLRSNQIKIEQNSPTANEKYIGNVDITSNVDNIITISTASITEVHSVEELKTLDKKILQLKTPTATTSTIDNNKIKKSGDQQQQYLPYATAESATTAAPTITATTTSTTSTAAATAKRKLRTLCNVTNWISFQDNLAAVHHRRGRRLHGLQLPLHPLQLFGWLVLILFGLSTYCVLIPSFTVALQGPLYGLITGLYIVHIVSHLTALLTDPADKELRRVHGSADRIVPEFDRNKHTHVIENGRCHLCNIRTSSLRTKHCSVCNKCVGKFDHHCKWLNHCIGSRNYVAFLMCVVSAVIATLVIVAAVIAQITFYYVQPTWLNCNWFAGSNGGGGGIGGGNTVQYSSVEILPTTINANTTNKSVADKNTFAFNDNDYTNVTLSFSNGSFFLNNNDGDDDFVVEEEGGLFIAPNNATFTTILSNITSNVTITTETSTTAAAASLDTTTAADDNADVHVPPAIKTNTTANTFSGISINDTIFLVLTGALGLLAAITAGLLLHLCFFHIYISFLGLTTYEYIRNHRQAQEARSKQLESGQAATVNSITLKSTLTLPKNGGVGHDSDSNPSKKTNSNNCGQIYCCSSQQHPNTLIDTWQRTEANTTLPRDGEEQLKHGKQIHCCANSREYHQQQRTAKSYYVCSLLEERKIATNPIQSIAGLAQSSSDIGPYADNVSLNAAADMETSLKTFHCCSSFAATTTQRRVSTTNTKAALVNDLEAAAASLHFNRARSYLQYTEQCTFCTFRLQDATTTATASPVNRCVTANAVGIIRGSNVINQNASKKSGGTVITKNKKRNSLSAATNVNEQRCCTKSISKPQRQKWSCCTSVPDSPDVPNDIISALALNGNATAASKINASEMPVSFIKTINGVASHPNSPRDASTLRKQTSSNRRNSSHTRPMVRLRHVLRMLTRYRQSHANRGNVVSDQVKQNQVRPLQLQQGHCQHQQQLQFCDSSSPQPASSTTPTCASELSSSELSISSESSVAVGTPNSITSNTFEKILPTSIIRDDTSITYTLPIGITLPPALPPPTRRKIPNPTDLEELAESMGFISTHHHHPSSCSSSTGFNNVYRRQRRKHLLRTRSPTLSPIHESGLSNPTSPQPLRHNSSKVNSPDMDATIAVINNVWGSNGTLRKVSSNSSLQSVSSNTIST